MSGPAQGCWTRSWPELRKAKARAKMRAQKATAKAKDKAKARKRPWRELRVQMAVVTAGARAGMPVGKMMGGGRGGGRHVGRGGVGTDVGPSGSAITAFFFRTDLFPDRPEAAGHRGHRELLYKKKIQCVCISILYLFLIGVLRARSAVSDRFSQTVFVGG